MRKLIMFNNLSLDGYFSDASGSVNWAHSAPDPELDAFTSSNASGDGELLLGRKTYEMMAAFWPTPAAREMLPTVAEGMNRMQKTVFSRRFDAFSWQNTRVFGDPILERIASIKQEDGPGIAILGSGSLVRQLAPAGLIDEYHVVLHPTTLGGGTLLFDGLSLRLKLAESRVFPSGKIFLRYLA